MHLLSAEPQATQVPASCTITAQSPPLSKLHTHTTHTSFRGLGTPGPARIPVCRGWVPRARPAPSSQQKRTQPHLRIASRDDTTLTWSPALCPLNILASPAPHARAPQVHHPVSLPCFGTRASSAPPSPPSGKYEYQTCTSATGCISRRSDPGFQLLPRGLTAPFSSMRPATAPPWGVQTWCQHQQLHRGEGGWDAAGAGFPAPPPRVDAGPVPAGRHRACIPASGTVREPA